MSKFNVGDKVVATRSQGGNGITIQAGHIGTVTKIESRFLSVDEFDNKFGPCLMSQSAFELYEEKQMFDMKKQPWYVKASEENFQAVVNWLKYKGFEFPSSFRCYREIYITNRSSSGTLVDRCEWAMYERTVSCKAREIKLSFKTETTITNVEFPEILTEKEIETKKIREEMEALAERLKKLENS